MSSGQISLVVYIVPVVIVTSLVLFSLSLFVFYMKRKKIIEGGGFAETHVSGEDRVSGGVEKQLVLPSSFQTISTTVSFDFKELTVPSEVQSVNPIPPLATMRKVKNFRKVK